MPSLTECASVGPAFATPVALRPSQALAEPAVRPRRPSPTACAKQPGPGRVALAAAAAATLLAGGAGGLVAGSPRPARASGNAVTQTAEAPGVGIIERIRRMGAPPTPSSAPTPTRRVSTSFVTAAVRAVGASVVRIDTERVVRGPAGILLNPGGDADGNLFDDPVLKKFFGEYYGKQGPGAAGAAPRLMRGQGSGFITTKEGLVITNAHVVKGADKVSVTLTDGRSFTGVVKGTDELLDLAVVKIDPAGGSLPVAPLGVSADLQVGDWVIAVGNPVGLDNTVTVGIVSSLNRSSAEVGIPDKRMSLIQTSAQLNMGNSGGPLLNEFGEVVGINTAVRVNAEAIGFAIPIDRAKEIAKELAKGKTIAHAYVGIQMTNVTPQFARQNNQDPNAHALIPEVEGALVMRVVPSSPAASGGIRRYDIIVSIDGQGVKNVKQAQAIVDGFGVGQVVNLKVIRGDRKNVIDIGVKTGDLAAINNAARAPRILIPGAGGPGGQ